MVKYYEALAICLLRCMAETSSTETELSRSLKVRFECNYLMALEYRRPGQETERQRANNVRNFIENKRSVHKLTISKY